ncbi:hypothetical protein HPT27_07150 [Permianibacter sp. IMCC34836]|uniref:hypothetical protein n=1 Tax=Permianibacter fluminis TaxID=2738515 RepID=UPI00155426D0|nr:hypothetical protein [Permianibacter fluminis]NQD36799.1 hypothetical protein [Permianibacter fluminis]
MSPSTWLVPGALLRRQLPPVPRAESAVIYALPLPGKAQDKLSAHEQQQSAPIKGTQS